MKIRDPMSLRHPVATERDSAQYIHENFKSPLATQLFMYKNYRIDS